MKTCLFFLALTPWLLAPAHAVTQEPGWSLSLDPSAFGDLEPYAMEATPDGGVLAVGRTALVPQGNAYVLVKLTENGDRDWSYTVEYEPTVLSSPYVEESASFDVDADGNIFLVTNDGDQGLVTGLDPSGAVVWERLLNIVGPMSLLQYSDIDASVPGDVVLCGVRIYGFPLNLPFDDIVTLNASDGSIRSRKTGTTQTSRDLGILTRVERNTSGRSVLAGQTDAEGFLFEPRVLVMGPGGGVIWHGELPGNGGLSLPTDDVAIDSSGAVVHLSSPLAGNGQVLRLTGLDVAGGVTYTTEWNSGPGQTARGGDLLLHPNGETWVAGSVDGLPAIVRFNGAGQFVGSTSVVGAAGQPGSLSQMALGANGAVHAIGSLDAGASASATLLAVFDASGIEEYSRTLVGGSPVLTDARFGGVDIALDHRGNAYTLGQSTSAGSGDLQLSVEKIIDGSVVGSSYCGPAVPNSTGVPASIALLGTSTAALNNLSISVRDVPGGSFVLLLASMTQGFTAQAGGGQGTLCLGGGIGRYVGPGQVRRANSQGLAYLQLELTTLPQPNGLVQGLPGETWNLQAWYRDANPAVTSNFTDGVALQLQ